MALSAVLLVRIIQRSNRPVPPRSVGDVTQTPTGATLKPLERVRALDWFQFERFMAALFSECGFIVQRFGGANPDGGLDLVVELSGKRYGVQCKHWHAWKVGVKEVREFVGALKDHSLEYGIFVTLQTYTPGAKAFAGRHYIDLADENEVLRMLNAVGAHSNPRLLAILNETRKLCPKCETEMELRTARKGRSPGSQFWGCSKYPRCQGRMDFVSPPKPMAPPKTASNSSSTEVIRTSFPKQHPDAPYMPKQNVSASGVFRFH